MTAADRALLETFAAILAARLPPAIGQPLADYSPVVLGWAFELVERWDARRVVVTAAPGVVPTVTIGE